MIAYGIIKVNGLIFADYLIVYHGRDETIGYNYIQSKTNRMATSEPTAGGWTFDYKVLSKSDSLNGVDIPDVNYLDVLPV